MLTNSFVFHPRGGSTVRSSEISLLEEAPQEGIHQKSIQLTAMRVTVCVFSLDRQYRITFF